MRFIVKIDSESDAVQTPAGCGNVLSNIESQLIEGVTDGPVHDANGNTIGYFKLKPGADEVAAIHAIDEY